MIYNGTKIGHKTNFSTVTKIEAKKQMEYYLQSVEGKH